jgi:sugar phosphate isomerase/epimerase
MQTRPQQTRVALSTMTCSKTPDPRDCLELLEELGNPDLELDFNLGAPALKAILTEFHAGNMRVTSVHNCNPKFFGTQQRYNTGLADLDETSRKTAIEDFRFSLELAAECGVSYCVGPMGRIEPAMNEEKSLRTLYRDGRDTEEFRNLRQNLINARAQRVAPHMNAMARSLDELAPICERLGVKFVPENRYEFGKLGLPEEIAHFQRKHPETVGYCHDFGHAMAVGCLGLWPEPDPLKPELPVDIWHINDFNTETLVDHLPLGKGDLSLAAVQKSVCSDGAVAVIEVRANHPPADVKAALNTVASWLKQRGTVPRAVATAAASAAN